MSFVSSSESPIPVTDSPFTTDRASRLNSWKEIAYFARDICTVQLWEKLESYQRIATSTAPAPAGTPTPLNWTLGCV